MNQTAQHLASKGRYGDTMLVHMAPQEVAGLQALARNNGTSMTINPQTGLPEAFSLKSLLPMIAGFALGPAGLGLSALQAGMITGGLGALATGSLKQGLMMGLGGAGGAGLAGSMANLAAPAAGAGAAGAGAAGTAGAAGAAGLPAGQTFLQASQAANAANAAAQANALAQAPNLAVDAAMKSALPVSSQLGLPGMTVQGFPLPPITNIPAAGAAAPGGGLASLPPSVNTAQTAFGPSVSPNLISSNAAISAAPSAGSDVAVNTAVDPQSALSKAGANFNRTMSGAKEVFGSPEAFMDFAGNNKMNLAMSAVPGMFETPEYEEPGSDAMIRPYTLETENLSGAPISSEGREDRRYRYRYVPGEPYRAAQGGIIAFADGGVAQPAVSMYDRQPISPSPSATVNPNTVVQPEVRGVDRNSTVNPTFSRVFSGAGRSSTGTTPTTGSASRSTTPLRFPNLLNRTTVGANRNSLVDTERNPSLLNRPGSATGSQRNYGVQMPNASQSATYQALQESLRDRFGSSLFIPFLDNNGSNLELYGFGYAEGGQAKSREVRKKINRMDDPYAFTGYQRGEGLYESAQKNFAGGGLNNVPRFLSGGGDGMSDSIPATINDRQPARLADGEFVIPADVVSHLGNGSSKAGAKQLYAMMDRIRAQRTGKKKQAPAVNPRKVMPA